MPEGFLVPEKVLVKIGKWMASRFQDWKEKTHYKVNQSLVGEDAQAAQDRETNRL